MIQKFTSSHKNTNTNGYFRDNNSYSSCSKYEGIYKKKNNYISYEAGVWDGVDVHIASNHALHMFSPLNCVTNYEQMAIFASCIFCSLMTLSDPHYCPSSVCDHCVSAKYMTYAWEAYVKVLKDEYEGSVDVSGSLLCADGFSDEFGVIRRRFSMFMKNYNKMLHARDLVWDEFNLVLPSRLIYEMYGNKPLLKSGEADIVRDIWESSLLTDIDTIVSRYYCMVETRDKKDTADFRFFYPRKWRKQ